MNSEKMVRYLEIVLYLIVFGSMFLQGDAPLKTQYYYYGMRVTSRIMHAFRRLDVYFAEHYFAEVNH